ncbi:MAG: aminoglycoside phosphotransferase family protein [Christensenellaceae bacterium]|nr:aminoglycoside phosphotransferase family protein [Christensenellaceae bacterium]
MEEIMKQFMIEGEPIYSALYGSGHINHTFDLLTDSQHRYIWQKINHNVFKDIPSLMNNIIMVTNYLKTKESDPRRVLNPIPTKTGEWYIKDNMGNYWRAFDFIEDSICLDRPESPDDFYESAVAFGMFQKQLADFPAEKLAETIPNFHNTPARYNQLKQAIKNNISGRKINAMREIEFALDREKDAGVMVKMLEEKKLPLRVTHNDTKLNNVMLDKKTRKQLCVIDLDCVMPGLMGNDFGDSIRFGASTANEDERDLSKVEMNLEMFEAFAKGFMETCSSSMTKAEKETLALAAKLMTLECGTRFLADYLNGDTYFSVSREAHNLDRCRTQFKLVADMEKKMDKMNEIVFKYDCGTDV